MKTHLNIVITGRVQGVGYRMGAKHMAENLGLTGWTMNQTDGSVRIEIEGDIKEVNTFLNWCDHGPFLAKVNDMQVRPAPMVGFNQFEIRH